MENKEVEDLARDSFSIHHFPGQYKTNLSWEKCSQNVRDWHITNAVGLIAKGYRKQPPLISNSTVRELLKSFEFLNVPKEDIYSPGDGVAINNKECSGYMTETPHVKTCNHISPMTTTGGIFCKRCGKFYLDTAEIMPATSNLCDPTSNCCNSPMTVKGDVTHYYVCDKCGKPCDPYCKVEFSEPLVGGHVETIDIFPSTQEIEDIISLSDLWKYQVTRTGLQRDKRHLAQEIRKMLVERNK